MVYFNDSTFRTGRNSIPKMEQKGPVLNVNVNFYYKCEIFKFRRRLNSVYRMYIRSIRYQLDLKGEWGGQKFFF